ncbi:4'-phosphopantetheinyl transferase family protein [Crocosphaera chwakensis]|uniref:4'-phosphopantetheinyl transferase n=1 Tax=Crocosphaera chwakensis CCY0110 TaxID=391612 RepID=A3IGV7_9CHRO|nr:4'-phosphopantetheinyl transferase superfamily protein [Crocosphaera chwakensis]EAZ94199.1 4'-phosphopantetheinyl transferase [Crocosphaera chwakensis CCY0110]
MNIVWKSPSKNLNINSQEVHIWKKNLEQSSINVQKSFKILNEDEKDKAQRFRFEKHQKRFTIARSSLKQILSYYLLISPQEIEFEYNDYGKPKLLDKINKLGLQFNVSHSEDIAIYGITCHSLIGVDIEYIRPMPEAENLAKRFFSKQEYEYISLLSSAEKEREFFKLWTVKEAYLKAIGKGISGGLEKVEISPNEPIKFLNLPGFNREIWQIFSFIPEDHYLAAIVFKGEYYRIDYWQF